MFKFLKRPFLFGAIKNAINAKLTADELDDDLNKRVQEMYDGILYFEVFKGKIDRSSFYLRVGPYLNEFERFFVISKAMKALHVYPCLDGEKWDELPNLDVLKTSKDLDRELLSSAERWFKTKHNLDATIDIEEPYLTVRPRNLNF